MNDYVISLTNISFDRNKLEECYFDTINDSKSMLSMYNGDIEFIRPNENNEEINRLLSLINDDINIKTSFIRSPANVIFDIHTDNPDSRQCAITFPVLPTVDIVGTDFYDENDNYLGTQMHSFDYPVLMDVQSPHGMINNDNERVLFQICIVDIPFNKCKEMIKTGHFFKNDK